MKKAFQLLALIAGSIVLLAYDSLLAYRKRNPVAPKPISKDVEECTNNGIIIF